MLDWLIYLAAAAACLVLLPYVLGPLVVKFTQSQPGTPSMDIVDPDEDLPAPVVDLYQDTLAAIDRHGFALKIFLKQQGQVSGQTIHVLAFAHPVTNVLGMAAQIRQDTAEGPALAHRYTEFFSPLADEGSVTTNNSTEVLPYPMPPKRLLSQHPELQDVDTLLAAHEAILRTKATAEPKPAPSTPEGLRALVIQTMKDEYERNIGTGYLYYDADGDRYRCTWKGACLMTWRLVWPMKNLLQARAAARGRALRAACGVA